VVTNFNKLIASADVSLIQETKCNSAEGDFGNGVLSRMAAGCEVFYSNSKKGTAGVATLVRLSFLELNVVTKVKLDPCLRGYVLALLVTLKDAVLKPYTIFNIYLSSQDAA
jgi:exonuclease III